MRSQDYFAEHSSLQAAYAWYFDRLCYGFCASSGRCMQPFRADHVYTMLCLEREQNDGRIRLRGKACQLQRQWKGQAGTHAEKRTTTRNDYSSTQKYEHISSFFDKIHQQTPPLLLLWLLLPLLVCLVLMVRYIRACTQVAPPYNRQYQSRNTKNEE